MAKIGTYPSAAALDGTEELIGVQSAASVKITPDNLRDYFGMPPTTIKTSAYTASVNEIVRVDTSGGSFTVTLPASPAAQDRVIIQDVGKACSTNPLTIARNGKNIDGAAADFTLDQNSGAVDAVYDGTDSWDTHLQGIVSTQSNIVRETFKPYDFTSISGELSRVQIGGTLDALQGGGSGSGYHWAGQYFRFPDTWDGGQVRFRYVWSPSTTNTGVIQIGLYGDPIAEGDPALINPLSNTGPLLEDTALGVVDDLQMSAWSSWTSLDTPNANNEYFLRFQVNASSGSFTFTGNTRVVAVEIEYVADIPVAEASEAAITAAIVGRRTQYISMRDMFVGSTQIPSAEATYSSNETMTAYRSFDDTAVEYVIFDWKVPDDLDEAWGLAFIPVWMPATTNTGTARFEIRCAFWADGDAAGKNFATGSPSSCFSDDAGQGVVNNVQYGPESTNRTFPSSPVIKGRAGQIRYQRFSSGDTLTGDANIIGIILVWKTDQLNEDTP